MGIKEVLEQNEKKDLLRLLTCGSVDDGKSTLIGRLLHDSKDIYEDHLKSLERDSRRVGSAGDSLDYSLLLDGLKAEREQGITIDVAYRYFSTPRRKFIIADTPGHEQYTRNMATGASTANLAVVLVDAKNGVVTQTKRHSFIASLLNIGHVVVAVNKMDLVDFSEKAFDNIRDEYSDFATRLDFSDIHFIPMSALEGDNVVEQSDNMPWYKGAPLLQHLESVHIASDRNFIDVRFPVQYVLRQSGDFRGYCGSVASGIVRSGMEVVTLPSGKRTKIKEIHTYEGVIDEAYPPMAVTLTTEDELDISRGDVLVAPNNQPRLAQEFEAVVVWMAEEPMSTERHYRIKQGTSEAQAQVSNVRYRFNINTIGREVAESLSLNEIGRVRLEVSRPLAFDPYKRNRQTGSFILIDLRTNTTVGAGMILDRDAVDSDERQAKTSSNVRAKDSRVSSEERAARYGHKPATVWLTGLPKSGKSTIATALERQLFDDGIAVHIVDGENLRLGLSENLGFSALDRSENIRRSAHVARICNRAGMITIVALVSPYRSDRSEAARIVGEDHFLEVFIDAPVELCEERDGDGLYERAKAGTILRFTGVSAPYEPPEQPDLHIESKTTPVDEAVSRIRAELTARGIIP